MINGKPAKSIARLLSAMILLLPIARGEEKKADAKEEPFSTVAPETLAKAKELPELKEILELRGELDTLLHEYRTRAMTKGTRAHPQAIRKLPSLVRQAEKIQKKLDSATQDLLEPIEKQLEKNKEEEAKLLRKLDKLRDKGKDSKTKDAEKEADQLRTEIERGTSASEIIREVGMPTARFSEPAILLLEELVEPNEQEEKSLRSFLKNEEDLIQGRLLILHLQADLETAQKGTEGQPADHDRAKAIERQLKQVNRKFAKYFLDIWEPIEEKENDLEKEKDQLSEKIDSLGDKPAARKYQEKLSDVSNKLQSIQRSSQLYKKIIRGTLAAEELAEREKQKKERDAADSDDRRPRRR
jgi:DNA-binding ferritin-like protein